MSHANTVYVGLNFVPSLDVFTAPRDFDLGQRERDHSNVLSELRADVATAELSKDAPTIELTSGRLAIGEDAHAAFETARDAMIAGEDAHENAVVRTQRAWARRAAGTLDAKEAMRIEGEVIAASAEERARRGALPGLRAQVSAASGRLMRLRSDDEHRAKVAALESTAKIVEALLDDRTDVSEDASYASKLGKGASPAEERWWVFASVKARAEFISRAAERRAEAKARMRSLEKDPRVEDFDRCLAARRGGLDGARREALAKAEELARFATGAA